MIEHILLGIAVIGLGWFIYWVFKNDLPDNGD